MSVLEQINAKASQLPPELQPQVLNFIEFLVYKETKKQDATQEQHPRLPNKRGAGKGLTAYIADDFDAPLDELEEV